MEGMVKKEMGGKVFVRGRLFHNDMTLIAAVEGVVLYGVKV